jgi:hypothetical protein
MAKQKGGPAWLPQRFDVWQVDARQLPEMQVAGKPTRAWASVVVSVTDGTIMGMRLAEQPPGAAEIGGLLAETMAAPDAGEAHRPTQVQLSSETWSAALATQLDELDVTREVVETLEAIDDVMAFLADKVCDGAGEDQNLLHVDGMTPESVGSFFDAAAVYYEQAPWKKVGERPIRIECARFAGGPWFAVLMGQAGMTSGLALYDSLETLEKIQQDDLPPEEMAGMTAGWAVVFGTVEDLPEGDAAAAKQHGWRVAGSEAYPSVYRTDPGLQMRPPTPEELHLLEACLRAVPEFVRKKSRRVEPTTIPVPTAAGEAVVGMAWVEW